MGFDGYSDENGCEELIPAGAGVSEVRGQLLNGVSLTKCSVS